MKKRMKAHNLLGPFAFSTFVIGESQDTFKIDFKVLTGNDRRDLSFSDGATYVVKRDSSEMELQNRQTFYLANIEIGSNEDEVGVLVDTGSSDLWIMSHDLNCEGTSSSSKRDILVDSKLPNQGDSDRRKTISENNDLEYVDHISISNDKIESNVRQILKSQNDNCTRYGSFRASNSNSFNRNKSANPFSISYADGTHARGFWGTDDVSFGNVTVRGLSFAVSNDTSSDIGVLGIGLLGLETTYSSQYGGNYQYENLPLKLKNQGTINKAAYSVYLGEEDSRTGTILFGAVDSAKYSGDLQTVQIVNSARNNGYSEPIRIEVIVNGITLNDLNTELEIASNEYTAVLDTGSTYSYFPRPLLSSLGGSLNGQFSSSLGAYIVDCIDNDDSNYISIDFSGVKLNVPLTSLIQRYSYNQCFLSVLQQSGSNYILFGDNVLRSAYLVYDLDDFEISIAQARYTSEEDISVISSSVPNAIQAPDYSSTSLPSSVEGSGSSDSTFGDDSNSGGRSSSASMNKVSKAKLYGLFIGLGLLVPLSVY
ncbi:unnamed protein product [Debaryomyces tyrocola]|nr:unnamed protein product [Debaryomyces tyrocola]